MTNIVYPLFFVIGSLLGSFANVLVLRDKERESIVTGRSKCPHCQHTLHALDLVPVLSYIFLRGTCRYCRRTISIQYPLVELTMAVLAVLAGWYGIIMYESVFLAVNLLICFLLFLVITVIDIRTMEVPVEYCVLAAIFGTMAFTVSWPYLLVSQVIGLIVGAGSIAFVLYGWRLIFKRDGMGEGDIWIAGAVGATVGYPGVLVALFSAVLSGAAIGLALIGGANITGVKGKKKGLQMAIPFGPFLFIGLLIALVWGDTLINWYLFQV